jgi:hypothetical protein
MAKIHPSVVAEFRLFGFYLSSGLLAPNTAPEKKLESLFASTELAEMLFGVFANALEVDESGGLINPGAAQLRASDFVSCFGETKGIHGMIFDSHELGLRTSEGS